MSIISILRDVTGELLGFRCELSYLYPELSHLLISGTSVIKATNCILSYLLTYIL